MPLRPASSIVLGRIEGVRVMGHSARHLLEDMLRTGKRRPRWKVGSRVVLCLVCGRVDLGEDLGEGGWLRQIFGPDQSGRVRFFSRRRKTEVQTRGKGASACVIASVA